MTKRFLDAKLMFDGVTFARIPSNFIEKRMEGEGGAGLIFCLEERENNTKKKPHRTQISIHLAYDKSLEDYILDVEGFIVNESLGDFGHWTSLFRGSFSELADLFSRNINSGCSSVEEIMNDGLANTPNACVCIAEEAWSYINSDYPEFAVNSHLLNLNPIQFGGLLAIPNDRFDEILNQVQEEEEEEEEEAFS